jgi:signal transduction histidine kinase
VSSLSRKPPSLPKSVQPSNPRLLTLGQIPAQSLKFTEHGEVGLRVSRVSPKAGEVVLHFIISDTGVGIPAKKHQLIFEAFNQADGSSTRRFGGTGLGLTIASQLVQMMGGQISLESDVGRGSTFHFEVHLAEAVS